MSKLPTTATAPLLARDDDGEEQKIGRLLAQDRIRLSSFVKNLNNGISFDDMDDDLKGWWRSRY